MPKGIIDTITFAITFAFALPVGLFGIQFLLSDQFVLGGVFVALAVLMVVVEEYITTPSDLPAIAAQRVAGVLTTESETDREREQS